MAFWGVEVTPTRRYLHRFDPRVGRLHISQATLGNGSAGNKSIVQCNVGDKAPVLLCCLMPEKTESCSLNLEFEEEGVDVIFSVVGPRSVHLAGYYLSSSRTPASADGDETDSYGEDIAGTDTDCSNDTDYDYEDDFIDDSEHIQTYPSSPSPSLSPSPNPKSRVVIENGNGNARRKRLKKKYQVSDSDADNHKPIILGGTTSIFDSDTDTDTDDEDSLPISSLSNRKHQVIGAKRKCQHSPDRGIEVSNESSLPFSEVGKEISEKRKKKKNKEHSKEGKTLGVVDGSMIDLHVEDKAQYQVAQMDDITLVEPVSDERRSHDKEVEKVNKTCPLSPAEHGPKKKGKKKRANEGKTQAGGTDNAHIDDKAQMQEAHLVGVTNDDHRSDAVAVAAVGGKKKKKKNKKKKAGDEPASEEEQRKEIDKEGIEWQKKHK